MPSLQQNQSFQQGAGSHSTFFRRAFTLLETLAVVSAVGIVGSISYLTLSGANETAQQIKLRSDVGALNRAISVYRANGGDVSGVDNPSEMLVRLKTALSNDDAEAQPGLTSAMLDTRIVAVLQSSEEASKEGKLRAYWKPEEYRFVLAESGPPGIKRFSLDDGQVLEDFELEQRGSFLKFATTDDWIWDYDDRPQSEKLKPTPHLHGSGWTEEHVVEPVYNPDDPGVPTDPPPGGDPGPDEPEGPAILMPPHISPDSGEYPLSQFPLQVTISDPNPSGTSRIFYSIDGRYFRPYSGPFSIDPDIPIAAFCASQDRENYLNSISVQSLYSARADIFAGQADGEFRNGGRDDDRRGRTDAVISYSDEDGYSVFRWGTPVRGTPPNSLAFDGSTIVGAEAEELFPLGDLQYYNGSVYSGTEAHEVTLNVEVALTTPELTRTIPYVFELENTVNRGRNADDDADFVRIKDRASPIPFELNGTNYYLVLQFGNVTRNGFSTVNQFHVHEGKSASTKLFGYFTQNPPD